MSGIKPPWYNQMPFNKDNQSNDMWENMQRAATNRMLFCKLCGQQIVEAAQDNHGFNADTEWEMQWEAHRKCVAKYQAEGNR